jgi:hypothetical protein
MAAGEITSAEAAEAMRPIQLFLETLVLRWRKIALTRWWSESGVEMPVIRGLQALGKFRDDMGGVTHVSRTPTRRIGDCLQHAVGLPEAGRPTKTGLSKNPAITLAEAGVDKNLAHQARKFAALPGDNFEALVGRHEEAASPIS